MSYYFDKDTDVLSKEITTRAEIGGNLYTFKTDNNVFSKRGLDFGTRTLLEGLNINELSGDILDFGCGYGPIGIYIASKTDSKVDMVDINERALGLAYTNAKLNNVNVNIFESNIYSNIDKKYDYIITNPPIRVGKKVLYEILVGAKERLKNNGELIFVINKDQGAKSTMKYLEEYYDVTLLEKSKGFYVISCKNVD